MFDFQKVVKLSGQNTSIDHLYFGGWLSYFNQKNVILPFPLSHCKKGTIASVKEDLFQINFCSLFDSTQIDM